MGGGCQRKKGQSNLGVSGEALGRRWYKEQVFVRRTIERGGIPRIKKEFVQRP